MNALEFLQLSEGRWHSHRIVHHLAFRQVETGELQIEVTLVAADDPAVVALCHDNGIDPALAIGGSQVRWGGTMDWDQNETHSGSTLMVLVPETETRGKLLREQGYAEKIPAVGEYEIDAAGAFVLTTEYETMSASERFTFSVDGQLRFRSSTVKRFGGFSTASFCTEFREGLAVTDAETTAPLQPSLLGG